MFRIVELPVKGGVVDGRVEVESLIADADHWWWFSEGEKESYIGWSVDINEFLGVTILLQ